MPHGIRAPYGYTDQWEIDEKAASDIRLIYQLACSGRSYQYMMDCLPGWKQDKIYYYIQQSVYTGTLQYRKAGRIYIEENHHPAIISRDVFEAVQVLQQMNVLSTSRDAFSEAELAMMEYAWQIGIEAWGEAIMQERWEERIGGSPSTESE